MASPARCRRSGVQALTAGAKPFWRRRDQIQGKTGWRLFFACVLCGPLAGIGVILLLAIISVAISSASGYSSGFPPAVIFWGAIAGAAIGWPLMIVFGIPAHILLYRRKSHRIGGYLLSGVLAGFLAALSVLGIFGLAGELSIAFTGSDIAGGGMLTLLLVLGSVAASSLFWVIRRPDRDVVQPDKLAAMFE